MGDVSFVLYDYYGEVIDNMTDDEIAILFRAIFAYRRKKALPEMTRNIKNSFDFIVLRMREDDEKYQKTKEKRAAGGAKGGRPRKNNTVDDWAGSEQRPYDSSIENQMTENI